MCGFHHADFIMCLLLESSDLVSICAVIGHGFSLVPSLMCIFRGLLFLSENEFKDSTTYFWFLLSFAFHHLLFIICIPLYAFYRMHSIVCILLCAFHCIYSIVCFLLHALHRATERGKKRQMRTEVGLMLDEFSFWQSLFDGMILNSRCLMTFLFDSRFLITLLNDLFLTVAFWYIYNLMLDTQWPLLDALLDKFFMTVVF